jgi:prevent-host-death family protein
VTTKVTATEAKAKFFSLLDGVAAGEEVEITRGGRTIARLIPARNPHALRGAFTGIVKPAKDAALFTTGVKWKLGRLPRRTGGANQRPNVRARGSSARIIRRHRDA